MTLIKNVRGCSPSFGTNCWLADNATIIGDVSMGDDCTVWFGAVIRGDVNYIRIGKQTNIQDNVTIHGTYKKAGTTIGSYVSIGHNAIVHGCTIEDHVLIGIGAIVLDHAVIRSGSIIGAGAVVKPGTVVEKNEVFAGIPAKKLKNTDLENKKMLSRIAQNYPLYASWFKE